MKDLNFFAPYQGKKKEKTNTNMYIYGAAGLVGFAILSTLIFNFSNTENIKNSKNNIFILSLKQFKLFRLK